MGLINKTTSLNVGFATFRHLKTVPVTAQISTTYAEVIHFIEIEMKQLYDTDNSCSSNNTTRVIRPSFFCSICQHSKLRSMAAPSTHTNGASRRKYVGLYQTFAQSLVIITTAIGVPIRSIAASLSSLLSSSLSSLHASQVTALRIFDSFYFVYFVVVLLLCHLLLITIKQPKTLQ